MSLIGALLVSVSPVLGAAEHCVDHNTNQKIQSASGSLTVNGVKITWSGDPGSVTFENTNSTSATVEWCAKGGNNFDGSGGMALDKMTTTLTAGESLTTSTFGTEISYFVLYSVTVTDPTPEDHEPDLEIEKSASESVVTKGDQFTYTIKVTNNGDATAVNVHVWDDLDRDITIGEITPSQGVCDLDTPSNDLDCWLGDLASGASATITIEVDTTGADCETIDNQAFAEADNHDEVNSEVVEVTIECDDDASLKIEKTDEQGNPLAGAVFEIEGLGTFTTDEDGVICITGLLEDSVWLVTEIQAPAGYEIADPASQMVDVDDDGDCDSPDAVFVNTKSEETPTPTPSEEETPTTTPSEEESATEEQTPSQSPSGSTAPSEGVKGGNPTPSGGQLPDTATEPMSTSVPATLLTLVAFAALAALTYTRLAYRRAER